MKAGEGLVERSRVSQEARRCTCIVPLIAPRREALAQLQALASDCAGRIRISMPLRPGGRRAEETLHAAQRDLTHAQQRLQVAWRQARARDARKRRDPFTITLPLAAAEETT